MFGRSEDAGESSGDEGGALEGPSSSTQKRQKCIICSIIAGTQITKPCPAAIKKANPPTCPFRMPKAGPKQKETYEKMLQDFKQVARESYPQATDEAMESGLDKYVENYQSSVKRQ